MTVNVPCGLANVGEVVRMAITRGSARLGLCAMIGGKSSEVKMEGDTSCEIR
jgi:hypothetical protein